MMESSVEMVTVRMSRGELSTPWGFDILPPAVVTRVIGGSLADRAGLQNGDHIDEIQGEHGNGPDRVRHLLHTAGHEIDLVVLRSPSVAVTTSIWHPSVTFKSQEKQYPPSSNILNSTPPSVKVSLEHRPLQSQSIPGFNTSAQPYQSELNNNQVFSTHSSPYFNKAEQYLFEKGGLFGTDPSVMKAREQPSYMQSETLKLIQEEERNGGPKPQPIVKKPDVVFTKKTPVATQNMPHCFICGRGIVGVACRVNEAVVHPECFQCSTCGASLKNVGHHYIAEKFYCDIHGQQRRQLTSTHNNANGRPAPPILSTMDRRPLNPDLAVKTPPSASHPTHITEPPKGFYQPDVLTPGHLSPSQPPRKPPIDSFAKTSVFNNQTYDPESLNNEDIITIGKPNQQPTPQSTSATLEARQMSRTFAPFVRSRSVRGIQWPPEPETEKQLKSLEAIKYWKLHVEPQDKQKKTLQELIYEEQESAKKYVRDVSPEKQKLNAKRVVATPHRLNSPMRNPLEAYAEKLRSTNNLSRTKSATSVLSIGPPPAVNVSWSDLHRPIAIKPGPASHNSNESREASSHHEASADVSLTLKDVRSSPEQNSLKTNDEWRYTSEVLEEKDILTDISSRQSETEEDNLDLPQFDERTSHFLEEQMAMTYDDSVSPSVDDIDRKSPASTIKEGDDDYSVNQAEKDKWIREEVEEARREEARKRPANDEYEVDENVERLLDTLALTPIQTADIEDEELAKEREVAIHVIEEHQNSLQNQQEQLSALLDNAIRYLKDTDADPHKLNSQSQVSPNIDVDSPSGRIFQKMLAHDDEDGMRKMTIYEQQRAPQDNGYGSNNGYADGIKQHGTLMNSNNMVPFCEQCKQQIRGAYVLATGLTWCPEHFTCANPACNRRLLDTGFVEEKGQKYCEKCFETLIAPICSKCSMPITADCLTALQKQWHPECFVCHHCSNPFGNAAFYLENGKPYCEQDWNTLFTTKCVSCKFPIEAGDRWVEAIGSAFHSNCFSCTVCQTNLEGQSFYAKNGLPFCRIHA